MIVLQIIGVLLLSVILLAVLWPFKYKIEYTYQEKLNYQITAGSPIFSYKINNISGQQESKMRIFGIPLSSDRKKTEEEDRSPRPEKETEKTSKSIPGKLKSIYQIDLFNRKNFSHVYGLLRNLLSLIKPKYYNIDITAGLPEPDLNGLLLAFFYSLKSSRSEFPVSLKINWEREVIETWGIISGSVVPLQLIGQLLCFLFSPTTLKLLWQLRRQQKSEPAKLEQQA